MDVVGITPRQQPDTYHLTTLESLLTYFKERSAPKVPVILIDSENVVHNSALPRFCTNSSSYVEYKLKGPLLLTSSNDSVTKIKIKMKDK